MEKKNISVQQLRVVVNEPDGDSRPNSYFRQNNVDKEMKLPVYQSAYSIVRSMKKQ